jgi:hypothetical protein
VKAYPMLTLAALCFAAACGGSPRLETRTFALHNLGQVEVYQLLRPYVDFDRPNAKGALGVTGSTVTVRETPDNLDRIARTLAEYDRPQPSVQLHFKLIRADGAARADSSIRDVETELRSLFRFRGYTLVAEGMVTGSQNSGSEQALAGSGGPYALRADIQRISGAGDSAVVHLNVVLHFPRQPWQSFETTVGIPVGRTAVLGNVTGSTSSSALILTVRPDLVAN